MPKSNKYYVGVDIGGTFIKGGVVDWGGNIICTDKLPTEADGGEERVLQNIQKLVSDVLKASNLTSKDVVGIGMGVPGMIDSEKGIVMHSGNLRWKNFRIAEKISALTGLNVKIANDANVATLAEVRFGAAKGKKNVVMLTLGTGVGGGIVCNGELYEGNQSVGAELGHMVIDKNGEMCACGRRGCLEAYASATALIRRTKKAMSEHPESKMWLTYDLNSASGKTAFEYKDTDAYAKEVVDEYINDLSVGVTDIVNVFRPEVVILGGGVCAEGDNLVIPLQRKVDEQIFARDIGPKTEIIVAKLGNSAGTLGAASLLME